MGSHTETVDCSVALSTVEGGNTPQPQVQDGSKKTQTRTRKPRARLQRSLPEPVIEKVKLGKCDALKKLALERLFSFICMAREVRKRVVRYYD
jgi:hypothetical protein